MRILNLKNQGYVFTDSMGNSLRISSGSVIPLEDHLISDDLRIAEQLGLIRILPDPLKRFRKVSFAEGISNSSRIEAYKNSEEKEGNY